MPTRNTRTMGRPAAIHDDPPETNAHGDPQARQAAALIRKGRRKQAAKVLISNGIAPRTQETEDIMKSMHEQSRHTIIRIPAPNSGLHIDKNSMLKRKAGITSTS